MTTMIMNTTPVTSHHTGDLIAATVETLSAIETKVNTSNGKYVFAAYRNDLPSILGVKIPKLGIRDRKRLKRYLNSYRKHNTLFAANRILWFLSKMGEFEHKMKIVEPQHEAIQAKRQTWLKLRTEAEAALVAYKEEKGTYYKNA